MENDSQAVAIGLGAGLGGFAGLLIISCILWQIFCGSWCDKKKVRSIIAPIPKTNQRRKQHEPIKTHSNVTAVTLENERNVYPDLQSNSPDNRTPR